MKRRIALVGAIALALLMVGIGPALASQRVWLHTYKGGSNSTSGVGVATDPGNGHVYMLTQVGCCLFSTIDTAAYDAAGTKLWTANSGDPAYDRPIAIAVDPSTHDVLVTGTHKKSLLTQAYSAAGTVLWTKVRTISGHELDPVGIVSDGHGRVVVAASTLNESIGTVDFLTIAYQLSNGSRLWYRNYGVSNADDPPVGIAADPSLQRVYVIGSSLGTNFPELVTLAYDTATGNRPWLARNVGGDDSPVGVAVDPSNHQIYAEVDTTADVLQWDTYAYSSAGAPVWHATYQSPDGFNASPTEIAVDKGNHKVYVAGDERTADGGTLIVLVGYSSAGSQLWSVVRDDGVNGFPRALTTDTTNHQVYLAGDRSDSSSGATISVIRAVSATGAIVWNATHSAPITSGVAGTAAVAADGTAAQVYLTGGESNGNGGTEAFLVAYHA